MGVKDVPVLKLDIWPQIKDEHRVVFGWGKEFHGAGSQLFPVNRRRYAETACPRQGREICAAKKPLEVLEEILVYLAQPQFDPGRGPDTNL